MHYHALSGYENYVLDRMTPLIKARDSRNRIVRCVTRLEAIMLVNYGFAAWASKAQLSIKFHVPKEAVLAFVHMMRVKPTPEATAIDSRTHKDMGGARGYKHVRNDCYEPAERLLSE